MFDLTVRTALVTGAGQNIGSGIARALAAQGAIVHVNDIVAERAEAVAGSIRSAGDRAEAAPFDVTGIDAVAAPVDAIGAVDVLVNNAGNGGTDGLTLPPFHDLSPDAWSGIIDVNLYGVLNCCHAVLGGMVERGWGRIVTISSLAGTMGTRVGVTPPSIYLHFADKNELLFECCSTLLGRLRRDILQSATALEDPAERLRVAAHAFVRFGIDNPEPYRIILMSPHHDLPAGFDPQAYEGLLAFHALRGLVADAMDERAGDPSDPSSPASMHAMGLLMAVHGVTSMMVAKSVEPIDFPWPDVDRLVDHVMDVHLAAIRRTATPPR